MRPQIRRLTALPSNCTHGLTTLLPAWSTGSATASATASRSDGSSGVATRCHWSPRAQPFLKSRTAGINARGSVATTVLYTVQPTPPPGAAALPGAAVAVPKAGFEAGVGAA